MARYMSARSARTFPATQRLTARNAIQALTSIARRIARLQSCLRTRLVMPPSTTGVALLARRCAGSEQSRWIVAATASTFGTASFVISERDYRFQHGELVIPIPMRPALAFYFIKRNKL